MFIIGQKKYIILIFEFLFQNRELQIMRKLEHCNIVKLKYFFYSSGDKVSSNYVLNIFPKLSIFENLNMLGYIVNCL